MLPILFMLLLKNFMKTASCNLTLNFSSARTPLFQYKDLLNYNARSIIFIYDETEEHGDFIKELFALGIPAYVINIKGRYAYRDKKLYVGDSNVFILFQRYFNIESLKSVVGVLQETSIWKNRDKILIFTNTTSVEDRIERLTNNFFKNWVINVAYLSLEESATIFIYNPFKKCLTQNFNRFSFDDILEDLNGIEVGVSMFSEPVNSFRIGNAFGGKDGLTAQTVMKVMNASFHYMVQDDGQTFGSFNSTFATGSYRDIIIKRAQISFNSRLLVPSLNRVEFTVPHGREDLVALVPKSYQQKDLFGSMPSLVWITSGILSVIIYIYFSIARRIHCNFPDIFLAIVLVLTGRPLQELNTKHFRIFYMSVMVVSLFLNTMFCCNLASFLAVPNHPSAIQTLQDLADSNYAIATTPLYTAKLNTTLDSEIKDRIISKVKPIGIKEQKSTILRCKKQVVICKDSLAKLALVEGASTCYVIMKEHVIPSLMCYAVNYGSPLLGRFNNIIQRLVENGLQHFWDRKETVREIQEGYSPIGLDSLYHPFKVYMFGLLVAILTFFIELSQCR